jgi:nucleoside-diphosphate-sugar epimerase
MKYIVTGSAGFIGNALAKELLTQGHEVVGIDCYLPNLYPNSSKIKRTNRLVDFSGFTFVEHDLRNEFPNHLMNNCAAIFHLAAMPGLSPSWDDFETYVTCNLTATNNILRALSRNPSTKLIYASTSSVYGNIRNGDETAELHPISPYGVTKLAAENLIRSYANFSELSYSILRLFSVYGPDQREDMAFSKIISALQSEEKVQVFGDGSQSRSNTFISDVVEAFILAENSKIENQTLNICGNEEVTLMEFIELAARKIKKEPAFEFLPARRGDQTVTKGNNLRALTLIGWRPKVSFATGVDLQISELFQNS